MSYAQTTRLRLLEKSAAGRRDAAVVRIFHADELTHCSEHTRCSIEVATGVHLPGVLRLSFNEAGR